MSLCEPMPLTVADDSACPRIPYGGQGTISGKTLVQGSSEVNSVPAILLIIYSFNERFHVALSNMRADTELKRWTQRILNNKVQGVLT